MDHDKFSDITNGSKTSQITKFTINLIIRTHYGF